MRGYAGFVHQFFHCHFPYLCFHPPSFTISPILLQHQRPTQGKPENIRLKHNDELPEKDTQEIHNRIYQGPMRKSRGNDIFEFAIMKHGVPLIKDSVGRMI